MIRAIPDRCPEWTDWNVSDPGITLIEIFALGMEELQYRLNLVLPKHMREYLNMIGVTLTPPSVAQALELGRAGWSLCDVAPTVMALLGEPLPESWTGVSLLK